MVKILRRVPDSVMVLRKKFSYQIRLFVPMVVLLWVAIIALVYVQYRRERRYKEEVVKSDIALINNRIIDMYERNLDLSHFLDFIEKYYSTSVIRDLSVALYDARTHEYIDGKGLRLPLTAVAVDGDQPIVRGNAINDMLPGDTIAVDNDKVFYSQIMYSSDSSLIVHTVMPYNETVSKAVAVDAYVWVLVVVVMIIVSLIAYFSTRHVARNIRLLRDFADRAASDRNFVTYEVFPEDELGDISRQIVQIYNARSMAVLSREHEHNIALRATEERERLKRQLTNNISHELKTPVGIIKGYVDTILESPDMDTDSRNHFLEKTQQQVNRLCDLLNDLSAMTRLEEAGASIPTEEVDFYNLVFTIASDVEESGIAGNMSFAYDVPFDCSVRANRGLLSAAVLNLAKNAAAYSKGTEMGIRCIKSTDKYYTFEFFDNGVGVAAEHLPHLFERFFRVDSGRSRKTGGTGLGLSIVKSTINIFGGTIKVDNGPTGGLVFTFTLPRWSDKGE